MKSLIFILSLSFSIMAHGLETVENLDIDKYLGEWHQLAAIPQSFQKDCIDDNKAEYSLDDDGRIKVLNSCREANGINVAEGRARVNPKFDEVSKLQVTFVKIFGWIWAFSGDYWVIKLGQNYQYSVVGHPDRTYLWILSREKTLPDSVLLEIRDFLTDVGYDNCSIIMSKNDLSPFNGSEKFCDIQL